MERHLGEDVHAASVTFSVIDGAGKDIRRDMVKTAAPDAPQRRITLASGDHDHAARRPPRPPRP